MYLRGRDGAQSFVESVEVRRDLPIDGDHRDAQQTHTDATVLDERHRATEKITVRPRAFDEAERVEWQDE